MTYLVASYNIELPIEVTASFNVIGIQNKKNHKSY